jgi:hypothetical protein
MGVVVLLLGVKRQSRLNRRHTDATNPCMSGPAAAVASPAAPESLGRDLAFRGGWECFKMAE